MYLNIVFFSERLNEIAISKQIVYIDNLGLF